MSRPSYLLSILLIILLIPTTALDLAFNSLITGHSSLPFNVQRSAYLAYAEDSANNTENSPMNFADPINLTNNTRDSVYAQVAAYRNNVYVIWEEEVDAAYTNTTPHGNNTNYDIYFKKSTDGGDTFSKSINISNNSGFSEHPQIAVSGNNIYIAWTDDASLNKEILFRTSSDEGNSFGRIINLSNGSDESYNQEISAFANNVYVVWENKYVNNNNTNHIKNIGSINAAQVEDTYGINNSSDRILFKASTDRGNSFKNTKIVTNDSGGIAESYPKIAASGNNVYVVWNVGMPPPSTIEEGNSDYYNNNNNNEADQKQGIFFTKSSDSGDNFSTSTDNKFVIFFVYYFKYS